MSQHRCDVAIHASEHHDLGGRYYTPGDRDIRFEADKRSDFAILRLVARCKSGGNADAIGFRTILAHLALALEPRDWNADVDDAA